MTRTNLVPAAIGKPAAAYSHGVLSDQPERILFTAGQVGMAADGVVATGIEAQLEQIYTNIQAVLEEGGMAMADVVQVRCYLTDTSQVLPNRTALAKWLGSVNPAVTTVIVKSLVSPDFLAEIEAVAAR